VGFRRCSRLIRDYVPLIAAGATTFGLIQNVAKDQDGKNLLPASPAPGPVFRQAFAHFLFTVVISNEVRGEIFFDLQSWIVWL
jgi:hypothetical protein